MGASDGRGGGADDRTASRANGLLTRGHVAAVTERGQPKADRTASHIDAIRGLRGGLGRSEERREDERFSEDGGRGHPLLADCRDDYRLALVSQAWDGSPFTRSVLSLFRRHLCERLIR